MEKTRVLIISRYFGPANMIAAIRTTKIAKYLQRNCNCEITVIAGENLKEKRDPILARDLKHINKVYRVRYGLLMDCFDTWVRKQKGSNWFKRNVKKPIDTLAVNSSASFKYTLLHNLSLFYEFLLDWFYSRQADKLLRLMKKNGKQYDIILSSYGPHSSNWVGENAKKYWPQAQWIGDYRDPIVSMTSAKIIRLLSFRHKKLYVRKPDQIVAVSQGCLDMLHIPPNKKQTVIPNGFDREDLRRVRTDKSVICDNRLHIAYCGTYYAGLQDAKILWNAIKDLTEENKLYKTDIVFHYMGSHGQKFRAELASLELEDIIIDHGVVSRDQSLKLQQQADVLLVLTWNNPGNEGVVSGKIFEYLMAEKPICCIVNGVLCNSTNKSMIEQGDFGFCYEKASDADEWIKLKEQIIQWLYEKRHGGIIIDYNKEYMEQFNYVQLAKRYSELFI